MAGLRWAYAGLVPAGFVVAFIALAGLAAPEHDDYCFAYRAAADGFVPTIFHFYMSLTGRITALALIQMPQVLASGLSLNILTTYPLVLIAMALLLVGGSALAISCGLYARGSRLFLLTSAFIATVISIAPSPHELLYWLPAVACYVPPALVAMFFLALLTRLEPITGLQAVGLSVAGFVVAMCNEFSAIWLVMIVAFSAASRHLGGFPRQLPVHVSVAAAVTAGFAVIALAPGNDGRRSVLPNSGRLWHSMTEGFTYSLDRLWIFLTRPSVLVFVVAAIIISTTCAPQMPRRRAALLAAGIISLCLACCYVEFFAHEYSTGIRLIERAENQALIFLLFGTALAASMLARAWLPAVASPIVVPVLAVSIAAALAISPTGRMLWEDSGSLIGFRREAIARDRALRDSRNLIPEVERHKFKPVLLMGVDADVNQGCLARYYGKQDLHVEARS